MRELDATLLVVMREQIEACHPKGEKIGDELEFYRRLVIVYSRMVKHYEQLISTSVNLRE